MFALAVGPEHRQKLHDLILGARGVALNAALESHIQQIEVRNKASRGKERAIPETTGEASVSTASAHRP